MPPEIADIMDLYPPGTSLDTVEDKCEFISGLLLIGEKSDIYSLGVSLIQIAVANYYGGGPDFSCLTDPASFYKKEFLKSVKRKYPTAKLSERDNEFFRFAGWLSNLYPERRPTAAEALLNPYLA